MHMGLRYYSISRTCPRTGACVSRVGVAEVSPHAARSRHHILAFEDVALARHVQHAMHPEPTLSLTRCVTQDVDVTQDVQRHMADQGLHFHHHSGSSIVLNLSCLVSVPKVDPDGGNKRGGSRLEPLHPSDVFTLPFEKNVGVLLPLRVFRESAHEVVLECNLMDPCSDLSRWKPPPL